MVDQICWIISYQYNVFSNFNWGLKLDFFLLLFLHFIKKKQIYQLYEKSLFKTIIPL